MSRVGFVTKCRISLSVTIFFLTIQTTATGRVDSHGQFPAHDSSKSFGSVTSSSSSSSSASSSMLLFPYPRFDPRVDLPSSPPLLRSHHLPLAPVIVGSRQSIAGLAPLPLPAPAPPPEASNSKNSENVARLSARSSSLSSESSSAQTASSWRWCYICSGKFPDRECELYPKRVSRGPAKTNCTKGYCTSYVRYKPKAHLVVEDENKKPVPARSLSPDDFDVTSIARECESISRGNTCLVDGDQLGVTCYSSCTTDFCNDDTRRPGWEHFRHVRPHGDHQRQQQQQQSEDETNREATGQSVQSDRNREEPSVETRPESAGRSAVVGGESSRSGSEGDEIEAPRQVVAEFRSSEGSEDVGQQRQQPRVDVVARSLPESNEMIGGSFAGDIGQQRDYQNRDGGMTDYAHARPLPPRADLPDRPALPPMEPGAMFPGMPGGVVIGDGVLNDVGDSNYTSSLSRNVEGAKASEAAKSKSGKVPSASSADPIILRSTTLLYNAVVMLSLVKPFL